MKRKETSKHQMASLSSSSTLSPTANEKPPLRVTFSPLPRSHKEEEELTRMKQFH